MRVSIGIDVGWSQRRRSCAIALRAPFSVSRARKFGHDVSVGLYFLDELLVELTRLVRAHPDSFRTAILVVDGPVGPLLDAIPERSVDGAFGRGGFYNRAPGYPITQGSGLELSKASARILRTLDGDVSVRPWLGGVLPTDAFVVAETNPTPAMALLLPQQEIATLPSRAHPKYGDGVSIGAKSDWYWRLGAGQYAARVLGHAAIARERNHERVAGLFTLALATALADAAADGSAVAALGDKNGIYVVPAAIDRTWEGDVARVGVAYGAPAFVQGTVAEHQALPAQVLDVAGATDDAMGAGGDSETVVLNDNAGLNLAANPWLEEIDLPRRMRGPNGIDFAVEATFRGRDDMFRISPSTLSLARLLGFGGNHLSNSAPVAFEATIV